VAVTLARPEAVLPPPFPTSARLRCYISNMAVAPDHRRQGVATAMLNKCERIARLWGQTSAWLHVEIANEDAERLYRGLGYKQMPWWGSSGLSWRGKKRQVLLMKELQPLPKRKIGLNLDVDNPGNSISSDNGSMPIDDRDNKSSVFVWNVKEEEEAEDAAAAAAAAAAAEGERATGGGDISN